jgi:hypothetical protein
VTIALRDRHTTQSLQEVTMTCDIGTNSKRRPSAKLAAGLAISAILALGTFATAANAEWRHDYRENYNWGGGYYQAPPVVYGSPYRSNYYGTPYYYPPVVYGPGIGISLPGITIGIR